MVHVKVAENIIKQSNTALDRELFYKGSLAPDGIMFRPGRCRQDKSLSHFCVGDQGWGRYTNYQPWRQQALEEVAALKGKVPEDFLYGYLCHVLTDIEFCRQFWNPVRLTGDDKAKDLMEADNIEVDSHLLASLEDRELLWELLQRPDQISLPEILEPGDMEILIDRLIHQMYADRSPKENHQFCYLFPDKIQVFCQEMAEELVKLQS